MRVELKADDFHLVALQRVQALAVVRVPDLRRPVERTCYYFIAKSNGAYP